MQDPHRRIVVAADMESYSKRNNVLQYRAQSAFRQIMDDAASVVGLRRVDWQIQQGGDGELAILPASASERAVAGRLAPVADQLLREYNQGLAPEARVRLRLAVHQGLVHLEGANGFPGDAVIDTCRLVDSPQVKRALRDFPDANVALVVSDSLYRDVIEHYRDLRPDQFARVRAEIPEKNFSAAAWIYVPGENAAHAGSEFPPEVGDSSTPEAVTGAPTVVPPAPVGQTFSGVVTHAPAQFGNHNTMRNSHG
ncbi:hypothetical protein [Actinoplanes xinjiangensis]|uniref:hypothetical protein n=1 Tax=Actinoplanes xinjiangensis TaxID=512350 RepID=UPI000D6B1B7A|nr:hypothetical protein [Actinoplanes xinjiangensis]